VSPDTVVFRRTEPVLASVTTTSREMTRRSGTQIVRVSGHPTVTCVNPTTSTETGGPSTFATITRAGLTARAITASRAIAATAMADRLAMPSFWCQCGLGIRGLAALRTAPPAGYVEFDDHG
jgi:hypothetical protein